MENTAHSTTKQAQPSKLRKKIVALSVGLMAISAPVVMATPAQAATSVSFCFRATDGSPYANKPVYLKNFQDGSTIRSGRSNSNGCGVFYNVPSHLRVYVKAYFVYGDHNIGQAIFEGNTPYYAPAGAGGANLSTGTVRLIQCTWGLYGYCAGLR